MQFPFSFLKMGFDPYTSPLVQFYANTGSAYDTTFDPAYTDYNSAIIFVSSGTTPSYAYETQNKSGLGNGFQAANTSESGYVHLYGLGTVYMGEQVSVSFDLQLNSGVVPVVGLYTGVSSNSTQIGSGTFTPVPGSNSHTFTIGTASSADCLLRFSHTNTVGDYSVSNIVVNKPRSFAKLYDARNNGQFMYCPGLYEGHWGLNQSASAIVMIEGPRPKLKLNVSSTPGYRYVFAVQSLSTTTYNMAGVRMGSASSYVGIKSAGTTNMSSVGWLSKPNPQGTSTWFAWMGTRTSGGSYILWGSEGGHYSLWGSCKEFILTGDITAQEQEQIRSYLMAKYGL